uniref:Ribonuclease A-domain domain-containing protein n=1 Tax=Haplochromis burtoni TaxID=8153 RepID=A0A3Q2WY21_HAPBU
PSSSVTPALSSFVSKTCPSDLIFFNPLKTKHVVVRKGSCDQMMKNINGRNECKEKNTFIKEEYLESVLTVCVKTNTGFIPRQYDVIKCKQSSKNPCSYKYTETKLQLITCNNGKPVHLDEVCLKAVIGKLNFITL